MDRPPTSRQTRAIRREPEPGRNTRLLRGDSGRIPRSMAPDSRQATSVTRRLQTAKIQRGGGRNTHEGTPIPRRGHPMADTVKVLRGFHGAVHDATLFFGLAALALVFWGLRPDSAGPAERAEASAGPTFVVVVEKANRQVLLYADGSLLAAYPCAVGRIPGSTPAGRYKIHHLRQDARFRETFVLDFPCEPLARRALAGGLIERADYERIRAAHVRGEMPPQDTPLGPAIELHGGGTGDGQWTAGCIALDDVDVQRLAPYLRPGTEIRIR